MVVWSVVAVVEIDLGVVNLGDEAPHDLVLSEGPWDIHVFVKLLPLPHSLVRARTDAQTNQSAQRATQLRSVLTRMYAVSIQNQITTTVP
jgi:hypothetical protein